MLRSAARRVEDIRIIIGTVSVTLERPRSTWSSALILVGLAGLAAALLAYLRATAPPSADVTAAPDNKIHVPLFIEPAQVRPTPRFRFTFDPPEALADLRAEEKLDAVVQAGTDDLSRAALLMRWTRAQWEPGTPNPYPPLNARIILRDIRRGFTSGFCAQYNYVLVQGLQSFGIPARYVSLREHEVIEARLPDKGRWICLDPLYDAWYADAQGEPLSVLEIHRRARARLPVVPSQGNRITDLPAHLEAFRAMAVWLKNDHISSPLNFSDLERYKVYFLDSQELPGSIPAGALTTAEPLDLYPG